MSAPLHTSIMALPLAQPRMSFSSGDYVTSFDAFNDAQVEGFIDLLIEQGIAHGHPISRDHARAVANAIGSEYQASLLVGDYDGRHDVIKGMTTTKEAYTAQGRVLYLEDIVVRPEHRRQGHARRLIEHDLLTAWQQELNGYGWETGRNNDPAHQLYAKLDPAFNVSDLPDVWRISERQRHRIANDHSLPDAHLAELNLDINRIIRTLEYRQPDVNFHEIITLLKQQEEHRNNGFNDPAFLVASRNGTFAFTSIQYSTFGALTRADTRLYFPREFSAVDAELDVAGVMRRASIVLAARRKRGPIHIEFANNVVGLDEVKLRREKNSVALAESVLEGRLGAERLEHDNSTMVAYQLSGTRLVVATFEALKRNPGNTILTAERRAALVQSAHNLSLELGQFGPNLRPLIPGNDFIQPEGVVDNIGDETGPDSNVDVFGTAAVGAGLAITGTGATGGANINSDANPEDPNNYGSKDITSSVSADFARLAPYGHSRSSRNNFALKL